MGGGEGLHRGGVCIEGAVPKYIFRQTPLDI